jgi:TolB-like protein
MGVVYKARDTKLDREVAIKFLPPHLSADKEAKKRFIQEAKSASALDHPNICTIHEIDETDDGATFIVMARYDGQTLRERIDEGPLQAEEALDIELQISSGLAKAHENGIIHRDIKPSNIMVTSDGHVKILDFGIAKLESATRITREGSTLGTAAYMSPEQATGADAGPGADVWATGVILYEMLTGRQPFAGEHEAAMLYGIVHEDLNPLPEEVTAANPGLQELVDRSLAKDPAARFSDSGEMRSAIDGFRGGSVRTGKDSPGVRSGFSSKPLFRWGLVVVLIAAGIFVLLKFARQGGDSPPDKMKIAVLPFANLGPSDDEYFSDGITDAITARLATIRNIRVMSRQSVIRYKGSDKSPEEIAEELGGVDYIIEGTVQRERPSDPSSRVRIIPQLIFTKDGTHVWADTYDREMADIFAIQTDIAEKIANAIDIALPGSDEDGGNPVQTRDLRAYEFYLKGNALVEQPYYDIDKMLASVEMYKKALEIEPDYVEALVALAIQSCWMAFQHYEIDSMSVRAKAAIDRALEIDPAYPEVYQARGTYNYVFYKDYKAAMSDFKASFDRNPSSLELQNSIGFAQRRFGQWEEARESFLMAKELDPGQVSQNFVIAEHLLWMRWYDEAEQYIDLGRALDPDYLFYIYRLMELYLRVDGSTDRARELLYETISRTESDEILYITIDDPMVQRVLVFSDSLLVRRIVDTRRPVERHLFHGEMYNQIGEREPARAYYDSMRVMLEADLSGTEEVSPILYPDISRLGFIYARLGMKEKAVEFGELAVERLPVSADALQGLVHLEKLAMIYAITGERDKAFDLLDQILAKPVTIGITPEIMRLDPVWDPIREDPRFDKIIEKYSEASN